ncbi:MAG: hypothetical protein IKU85_01670 [Bacteroidaceae bacterium]|nr:hypothetical protein [Bacteroidaceae bacterium]
MFTKAIVQSINADGTRCLVRMPLFETAAQTTPVEAEALVNITPGIFNNIEVGDIVFISFEEGAIEKPIILGKLFRGASIENNARGGGAIVDTIKVRSSATLPSATVYDFPAALQNSYKDLNTPKKTADYIKWLEKFIKGIATQIEDNFTCLKNWVQWQLNPENVEIDDGDLDVSDISVEPCLYQDEGSNCNVCGKACTKKQKRVYQELPLDKIYPDS